ncbi:MAG: prefoldin subunit beta [Thaumarchaeota archaeon]|nr:prefoldin subunit beta [Nitrososphaerota archaeon]
MSAENMPPWLQEQLMKLQQSQQNLQAIMGQKQQLEMERAETDKALEELQKAGESDNVYKFSGTIMIKSTKQNLITELEEKKLMDQTRSTVLEKQEERVKTSLKEQETKITEMMKGSQPGNESPQGTSTDNPRR